MRARTVAALAAFSLVACAVETDTTADTTTDTIAGDTGMASGATAATGFADTDRDAIETASEQWITSAEAENWEQVSGLYTEDAVLMPPNAEPVSGRAAVRDLFAAFPPLDDVVFDRVTIDGGGDIAFVHGNYHMTFTAAEGQAAVEDHGKYIEIWRRQPDGQWRITHDIFNSNLPAAGGQ